MQSEPKRVCIIHSDTDIMQVRELAKTLRPLQDQHVVVLWYADAVPVGANIQDNFLGFLPTADVVLLWISRDLWHDAESFVWFKQHTALLKPGATVVPLLARHATWESDGFLKPYRRNIIPAAGTPMPKGQNESRDAWFTQVANSIASKLGLQAIILEEPKPDVQPIKKTPLWRKLGFWGWLIPVLISLVALYLAFPSYLADDYENRTRQTTQDSLKRALKADTTKVPHVGPPNKSVPASQKQAAKTTPAGDKCSGQKPIIEELSGLKGRLTCCYREGAQIVCNIVFTRTSPGDLQFCANSSPWITSYTDDTHQTNKAARIKIDNEESSRCLERPFREVDDEVNITLIFDNCSQSSKKLSKLKVATSIGSLTFRNIPIL